MSDTFDHEADAWDSLHEHGFEDYYHHRSEGSTEFTANALYYHTRWKYNSIVAETAKALLLEFDEGNCWVPKSLCKSHCKDDNTVYIWDNFNFEFIKPPANVFTEDLEDD
jgi:hypothetical protein